MVFSWRQNGAWGGWDEEPYKSKLATTVYSAAHSAIVERFAPARTDNLISARKKKRDADRKAVLAQTECL